MWRTTKSGNPNESNWYLVYAAPSYQQIFLAWWDEYNHRFQCGAYHAITHWMPLPAPPTAEDSGSATVNVPQQGQPEKTAQPAIRDYAAALLDLKQWIDDNTLRDHAGITLSRIYQRLLRATRPMRHTQHAICGCRFGDAWRCAIDQHLAGQVACACECHKQQRSEGSGPQ